MSSFDVLSLRTVCDQRGMLTILQDVLPFVVRRMFWITSADDQIRGGHRHHVTRQALVALAGRVEIYMNDGNHERRVMLDSPSACLLVEPEDWHTMTFGAGAVLLVLASHAYDQTDYIDQPYSTDLAND
jgi:hypothetical protein